MNEHTNPASATSCLIKPDPFAPAFKTVARDGLVIKSGVAFGGHTFVADTFVPPDALPDGSPGYLAGGDYVVTVRDGVPALARATAIPAGEDVLGGFHFAPGGNAPGIAGGDDIPAINPCSLWDITFRPACPDPRGMTLIDAKSGKFWCDIYLTGVNHAVDGTSKFGAVIADGESETFDYAAACAVMAAHGKSLLSIEEFFAAAYGVTERSSADRDPEITKLDAPRTSRFGLMQATGNLWVWGHDGHPDQTRASLLGGSWLDGDLAGSRAAVVGYWPDNSGGDLGARGRSDHLQPE